MRVFLIIASLLCVFGASLPGAYRSGDPVKDSLSYQPENIFPPVQETLGENSSLLWQISGNGLEEPSYLFGTLHLICPERFSFPVEWMYYFYNTSRLVLELDLSDSRLAQEFQEGMFMTDGNSIEGLLDTQDLQILADFLADSVDLDITHTRRIMPMLLSAFLYPHMLRCQPESYDYYLTGIALQNDYEIRALETVSDQLSFFRAIPYKEQASLLMEMISKYEETRELYNNMVDLYLEHDLYGLFRLVMDESMGIPEFDKIFLAERNVAWMEHLVGNINETPSFIAVGAGHLPGEQGLIKLLEAEGYHLEPVFPDHK
ncbi:MAG: TraB/GumN family protein [Bacteroidales bacterium]